MRNIHFWTFKNSKCHLVWEGSQH